MTGYTIDALQYASWSEPVFRQMREGGVSAVHVTVAYHEGFRDMVANFAAWNRRFEQWGELILRGETAADIERAKATGRTAIFFGSQTPQPIEEDLGLIEIVHQLGLRFMQLSYNNQSALAAGYAEHADAGLTRFGREAVSEMNRVGLVIDLSHTAERSCLEAIDASSRPVAVTHANPYDWHATPRNKSHAVLKALTERGGMLGFSLYPAHLREGSECGLGAFCEMVAETVERYGIAHLGIGSDLCQGQPDSVVAWMREGRWKKRLGPPPGDAIFPRQPSWFVDNRDFSTLRMGLANAGFAAEEVDALMGGNWHRFFAESFGPA